MNAGTKVSLAARTDLNIRTVGDEVLVHDPVAQRTHALDPVSAAVLSRCDGATSLDKLASATGSSVEQVRAAVDELEANGLVTVAAVGDVSRRRVITRVAAAGAAGVAIPVVQSVVAPAVAAAQTDTGGSNGGGPTPGLPVRQSTVTWDTFTSQNNQLQYRVAFLLWYEQPSLNRQASLFFSIQGGVPINPANSVINITSVFLGWFDDQGDSLGTSLATLPAGSQVTAIAGQLSMPGFTIDNTGFGSGINTGLVVPAYTGTLSGSEPSLPTSPNPYVPNPAVRNVSPATLIF